MPVSPLLYYLPECAQTYAHWVGDAIQPSHPLLLSSPFAPNLSQHIRAWFWDWWAGSSIRVPDWKAIRPTLADLSSLNQQEMDTEKLREVEKVGKVKPWPWSPCGRGSAAVTSSRRPPTATEGLTGNALDSKSQGSSSTCNSVRGGRIWAVVSRAGVSHLQLSSY